MLNKSQIILLQTALRAAGLRGKNAEGRYRLLLSQYLQSSGGKCTSSKQLNNSQLDDILAICEAHGWQCPGKAKDYFRNRYSAKFDLASYAQLEAIDHLRGDLGWDGIQLAGMINRMTKGNKIDLKELAPREAYKLIEALKAIIGRQKGKKYTDLNEIRDDFEGVTDDKITSQVG